MVVDDDNFLKLFKIHNKHMMILAEISIEVNNFRELKESFDQSRHAGTVKARVKFTSYLKPNFWGPEDIFRKEQLLFCGLQSCKWSLQVVILIKIFIERTVFLAMSSMYTNKKMLGEEIKYAWRAISTHLLQTTQMVVITWGLLFGFIDTNPSYTTRCCHSSKQVLAHLQIWFISQKRRAEYPDKSPHIKK